MIINSHFQKIINSIWSKVYHLVNYWSIDLRWFTLLYFPCLEKVMERWCEKWNRFYFLIWSTWKIAILILYIFSSESFFKRLSNDSWFLRTLHYLLWFFLYYKCWFGIIRFFISSFYKTDTKECIWVLLHTYFACKVSPLFWPEDYWSIHLRSFSSTKR